MASMKLGSWAIWAGVLSGVVGFLFVFLFVFFTGSKPNPPASMNEIKQDLEDAKDKLEEAKKHVESQKEKLEKEFEENRKSDPDVDDVRDKLDRIRSGDAIDEH